jgi:hypothetical protein
VNDHVDRALVVFALRSDNQAGNEGGTDDCDDEVRCEAGRHWTSGAGGDRSAATRLESAF